MTTKPVGWLNEYSKLEDMNAASSSPRLLMSNNWPVKFRLINRDTVLPGQTLLFMDDKTLQGKKLEAYVLLKILKYCTGSSAKSYDIKFAIRLTFPHESIKGMEEMGLAIKKVINQRILRDKFSSIHPDLAAEGIIRVEVGEEGLHFIRSNESG